MSQPPSFIPPLQGTKLTDASPGAATSVPDGIPIVAFCHLSWNWVWQRPQQYLSRFARRHPVLFVETYCSDVTAGVATCAAAEGHPNVMVLRVDLPESRWHDGDFIDRERR